MRTHHLMVILATIAPLHAAANPLHHHHHATQTAHATHRMPDEQLIYTLAWQTRVQHTLPTHIGAWSRTSLVCLALNSYHEDRSGHGKDANYIAHVALNRTQSHLWGDGVCNTIYSTHPKLGRPGHGFSWVIDGGNHAPKDTAAWTTSLAAVVQAASERDPTHGALYYVRRDMHPDWAAHMIAIYTPGTDHRYYVDHHAMPMEVAEYTPTPRTPPVHHPRRS